MSKRVAAGENDCISSIAFEQGFFPDTLWDHPDNATLRQSRSAMSILHKGDEVFVPTLQMKHVDRPTDQRHRFRRRGVPAKLRVQLLDLGVARAGIDCTLVVDGVTTQVTSDADGVIELHIPNNARAATLFVAQTNQNTGDSQQRSEESEQEIRLHVGRLAPIDEALGVQQRLMNLGFLSPHGTPDAQAIAIACGDFQAHYGLEHTREADSATRDLLETLNDRRGLPPAVEADDDA